MLTRTRPGSNDEGETLLELLIAVAIMGIAVVAIVGGIATSILMSDTHRKQATAGAYVRNYAEAVMAYAAAGTPASNANFDAGSSPDYSELAVGFTPPTGFTAAPSVQCWNDTGSPAPADRAFGVCDVSKANAVQQVTLSVASSDSRASESLVVVVRKPW